jgi:hypothetical protein
VLGMNKSALLIKSLVTATIVLGAFYAGAWRAEANPYAQTDLVSDIPGLATITDPELVNPWGVAFSATSPFLDFEPGYQYSHPLRGDGQHERHQNNH